MPSVRVGGVWIERVAPISGLTDSTIYRTVGDPASKDELAWSGDWQASVQWAADANFAATWLTEGVSTFEVVENAKVTWGGILAEATPPSDPGGLWSLTAYGYGNEASAFSALDGSDNPSSVPNTVLDAAQSNRGMRIERYANTIGASAVGAANELLFVSTVASRAAMAASKRWSVDSFGEVSLVSDPTSPVWGARPGSVYMGSPDSDFVSHLAGYYVSAVSGTPSAPSAWSTVWNSDTATADEAAEQYGRREHVVDLTVLGVLSAPAAQALVDARYTMVGARMAWTNSIELDATNLRRLGWGAADPMSMCGTNGAGSMIRVFGAMDSRSRLETRTSIDVVLGEVTRIHDERRVVAAPVGIKWRDFQGALEAAQPPVESVTKV